MPMFTKFMKISILTDMSNQAPSPVQELQNELLSRFGIRLLVKRDDLLHPDISGNKWRKLKYNLIHAKENGDGQLLTFGGAFSNHIAAVAAAGKTFHFKTIGIIRGEKVLPLNPTLSFAKACGMELHFIERRTFRKKNEPAFIENLSSKFGDFYLVPEGGTNCLALKGCEEIITEISTQITPLPDYFCVACGTGGTVSGIISALNNEKKVIGFSVLKGDFIQNEVSTLLKNCHAHLLTNWQICNDYHFGGYAKFNPELVAFINNFKSEFDIPLDPIYTGKLFYGVFDLIRQGHFKKGTTIMFIHTGGLQGIRGFNQRFGDLIQ